MTESRLVRDSKAPRQEGVSALALIKQADALLISSGCDIFGRRDSDFDQQMFESNMVTGAYCSWRRR